MVTPNPIQRPKYKTHEWDKRLNKAQAWQVKSLSGGGKKKDAIASSQPFGIKEQKSYEPLIEFRDCKSVIIDFIRNHDTIWAVQNYLYDREILQELKRKKPYMHWLATTNMHLRVKKVEVME